MAEDKRMVVFIVGLGTIGEPLARLFLKVQKDLGIDEIIIHKNTPELKYRGMLSRFNQYGAKLAIWPEKEKDFRRLLESAGFGPAYDFKQALARADVVIDCTKEKVGRELKEKYYSNLAESRGNTGRGKFFIAQGSEKGFGRPYAYSINDKALVYELDRFVQVVSCNTHQILCILKTLVFDHEGQDNLVKARFYLGRRASDISQTESTVGIEIGEPKHEFYGSHQAEDAARVLKTIGIESADIHTQADKLNQSFMHLISFQLELKKQITVEEVERRFRANPLTAVTYWMTNNEVFSAGRDWGHFGRILNQTVVHLPSLQVLSGGKEIVGRCSTPQDGNALLSSVAATLWFKNPKTYLEEMERHFYRLPFIFGEL